MLRSWVIRGTGGTCFRPCWRGVWFDSQLSRRRSALSTSSIPTRVPLRKQLKDEAKALKTWKRGRENEITSPRDDWELTVGVEIHAQLDTESKLFSRASTSNCDVPNSNVALFDLAFPGSQPEFHHATLLPALRAALAFHCEIQHVSRFDRKHYFHHDQPAGYQITQYYEPFARNGYVELYSYDGIAPEDAPMVRIDIKQIQLEQDTAKSQEYSPSTHLLDFNRVSHPLIEIITMPHIHSPRTAAACVKKILAILQSAGSVTTGMELGGLRADVNVSVRKRGVPGASQYHGVAGLGQRTEIKNLSSIKAVEDAVIAERNRQITILESGGTIEGETRGWSLGSTETRKLRGKEGEIDYRYMPDPDLGPVIIDESVVSALKEGAPMLPDQLLNMLVGPGYGLSIEDAKPLIELDNGARLDYYQDVVEILNTLQPNRDEISQQPLGKTVGNWVLHELGGLITKANIPWSSERVRAQTLAEILDQLLQGSITGPTAKLVLALVFDGDRRPIPRLLEEENLLFQRLSQDEYIILAREAMGKNPQLLTQIREERQVRKLGWFVGQMMRMGERGRIEAHKAEAVLKELILGDE